MLICTTIPERELGSSKQDPVQSHKRFTLVLQVSLHYYQILAQLFHHILMPSQTALLSPCSTKHNCDPGPQNQIVLIGEYLAEI